MSTYTTLSGSNKHNKTAKELYVDLAKKAAEFLKSKDGKLLVLATLCGEGLGYYWSPSSKGLVLVPRKAEWYYLPWKKDEKGRVYLYSPNLLTSGVVICVDPEEVTLLGLN